MTEDISAVDAETRDKSANIEIFILYVAYCFVEY